MLVFPTNATAGGLFHGLTIAAKQGVRGVQVLEFETPDGRREWIAIDAAGEATRCGGDHVNG